MVRAAIVSIPSCRLPSPAREAPPAGALLILAISLAVTGAAAEEGRAVRGVIGEDDRRVVESLAPPWNAVGKVNIAGYRRTRHCTGTVIAPRAVVTAAHCLLEPRGGVVVPLRSIHFLAGVRRAEFLHHARAKCVKFMAGFRAAPQGALVRADRDVAVIVTADTVDIPAVERSGAAEPAPGTRLVHASYARDRPHMLAADTGCRLRGLRDGLWLTDCDTGHGGSGGPVFAEEDGRLRLAAIMIGYVAGKHSVAVPVSVWGAFADGARCD